MSIVSSSIVEDRPQKDGRRSVRERHVDNVGLVYFRDYLAEAGADANAALAASATQIAADLVARELDAAMPAAILQQAPSSNYATLNQVRARIRADFASLTSWDATRLGNWINGLGLSDAQLAALFGVANPSAALTAIKTRLANCASHYSSVIADAGA